MKAGNKEIRRIHGLLAAMGMAQDKEYKQQLVQQYTHGRETSTTGLTMGEAGLMIDDLQALVNKHQTAEQKAIMLKRNLIFHYAHGMMWEIATPPPASPKVDVQRVNDWCKKYGQFHKPLNDHSLVELSHLIVQFEKVYKSFLKSV